MQCVFKTEQETYDFATRLAAVVEPGEGILLAGDLGAGKTVLARGLIHALLSQPEDVPSPTFTLVQTYDTQKGPLWHVDLYRLERPEDVYELGLDMAFAHDIVVVEWPERLPSGLLPENRLELSLSFSDTQTGRMVDIAPRGRWEHKINDIIT